MSSKDAGAILKQYEKDEKIEKKTQLQKAVDDLEKAKAEFRNAQALRAKYEKEREEALAALKDDAKVKAVAEKKDSKRKVRYAPPKTSIATKKEAAEVNNALGGLPDSPSEQPAPVKPAAEEPFFDENAPVNAADDEVVITDLTYENDPVTSILEDDKEVAATETTGEKEDKKEEVGSENTEAEKDEFDNITDNAAEKTVEPEQPAEREEELVVPRTETQKIVSEKIEEEMRRELNNLARISEKANEQAEETEEVMEETENERDETTANEEHAEAAPTAVADEEVEETAAIENNENEATITEVGQTKAETTAETEKVTATVAAGENEETTTTETTETTETAETTGNTETETVDAAEQAKTETIDTATRETETAETIDTATRETETETTDSAEESKTAATVEIEEPVIYDEPVAVIDADESTVEVKPIKTPFAYNDGIPATPIHKKSKFAKPITKIVTKKRADEPTVKTDEVAVTETKKNAYNGKWKVEKTNDDKLFATLTASNGGSLLSTQGYSNANGLKTAISNIKKNLADGNVSVNADKNGKFVFKIFTPSGRTIVTSGVYGSKFQCEKALESTKRFAETAVIAE